MPIENMAYDSKLGNIFIKEEMFVKEESMDDESTKEEEGSTRGEGHGIKVEDDAVYLVLDDEERSLKNEIDLNNDFEQLDSAADAANPECSPAPVLEPECVLTPAPDPDPDPDPDTDDVDNPSSGSQEHTPPAISKPERRVKRWKTPGAVPAVTGQGTQEKVLETAQKLHHNLGGVMDMVEEPEMKYWRTSLEIMAKDCVGLPASYSTALKMELLAAIDRFRNAHEEGVAKPGPDLMLHAYRNFGFPAPQPQPQAQQQHPPPADTVAGVRGQPMLYHGTPPNTLPPLSVTRPNQVPAFTLPAHQVAALQTLLQPVVASIPAPNHLSPDTSAMTSLLSQFDLSQFTSSSFCMDLVAAAKQPLSSHATGMPAHYSNPGFESLETPQKEQ